MKFTIRMLDICLTPFQQMEFEFALVITFFEIVFTITHDTPSTMLNQDFICIHVYLCSYNIASAPQRAQL